MPDIVSKNDARHGIESVGVEINSIPSLVLFLTPKNDGVKKKTMASKNDARHGKAVENDACHHLQKFSL